MKKQEKEQQLKPEHINTDYLYDGSFAIKIQKFIQIPHGYVMIETANCAACKVGEHWLSIGTELLFNGKHYHSIMVSQPENFKEKNVRLWILEPVYYIKKWYPGAPKTDNWVLKDFKSSRDFICYIDELVEEVKPKKKVRNNGV